nr:DUF4366 domain-containing protein [uncultured Acetatifactor sp.]
MRTDKLRTLLLALVCLLALSATALAKVEGDGSGGVIETWAQIAEPPADAAPAVPAAPANPSTPEEPEPDGGGFYTRDLLYDKDTHKQFITVQGREGSVFYIVIDYDVAVSEDEEQYKVYFLNQVDESDLAALVEGSSTDAPPACSCIERCVAGTVNTSCPVCAVNMTECAGKEPRPEPAPEPVPEPEPEPVRKGNAGGIAAVLLLAVLAGGGAACYLKFFKKKPDTRGSADLDDYDYGEEELAEDGDEPERREED